MIKAKGRKKRGETKREKNQKEGMGGKNDVDFENKKGIVEDGKGYI